MKEFGVNWSSSTQEEYIKKVYRSFLGVSLRFLPMKKIVEKRYVHKLYIKSKDSKEVLVDDILSADNGFDYVMIDSCHAVCFDYGSGSQKIDPPTCFVIIGSIRPENVCNPTRVLDYSKTFKLIHNKK